MIFPKLYMLAYCPQLAQPTEDNMLISSSKDSQFTILRVRQDKFEVSEGGIHYGSV